MRFKTIYILVGHMGTMRKNNPQLTSLENKMKTNYYLMYIKNGHIYKTFMTTIL